MSTINEIKEDIKEIKKIVTQLQIDNAVISTKQKGMSAVFGVLGGMIASIVSWLITSKG